MAHHSPAQSPRSSPPSGVPEVRRVRAREALVDYDCHGDALFSLALLLCRDVDLAADAVVATLTLVDGTPSEPCPNGARRQHLAADLWNRCARVPDGRLPEPAPYLRSHRNRPSREQDQPEQYLAVLGLVLFGAHTYGQAAALIGLPASSAAVRSRALLHHAASVASHRWT
ncbi:hypothetical protein [Streptomyces sp. WZ.A104]|uniref:hypothetical protein n=1 Tax=Streptomyces sp. WZ.A104 TaxID=2023771 RepID=UPI00117FD802|nr:hypothetical protein [Streptomyces sp. WZ.A104]